MNKEKGVSPVIATILMVAITVVLAATIYVVVANMLTTPYSTQQFICTLSMEPSASNSTKVVFSVSMSSPDNVLFDRVRIGVMHNGTYALLNYSASSLTWSNYSKDGSWHFEAKVYDNDNNKKLDTGDEIVVYIVNDKSSGSVSTPKFISGDSIKVSVYGYNGMAQGDITV